MMATMPPAQGGIQVLGMMAIQAVLSLHASRRTMDTASHTAPIYEGYLKNLANRGCSFTGSAQREIARDVEENLRDYDTQCTNRLLNLIRRRSTTFPDGNIISVGAGRFHCVEVLFQVCSKIHDTSFQYIMKCEVYIRKDLNANVVPSGGTAIFQGIVECVTNELTALAPSTMRSRWLHRFDIVHNLPDRNIITVGAERFLYVEVLFQLNFIGEGAIGIHDSSLQSNMKCGDTAAEFVFHVVLSNGTIMFQGISKSMTEELTALSPSTMRSRWLLHQECVRQRRCVMRHEHVPRDG